MAGLTAKVLSSNPSYDSGFDAPLSVDTSGNLRVTTSGSGSVTSDYSVNEDDPHSNGDALAAIATVRRDTAATSAGADGDYATLNTDASGRLWARSESRFVNAAFTTLTRPANTTAYTANDSISDNATAGSVTALSASLSDVNDDPVCITELILDTNDTGLAASVSVRAYLYNSDPTASTGVGGGDNAAFSNKKAGFIGSLSGSFRAFSDGGKARLVPDEGSFIIANPTSGAKTLYVQYQTLGAFTPSANSTTIAARAKGFQGRA